MLHLIFELEVAIIISSTCLFSVFYFSINQHAMTSNYTYFGNAPYFESIRTKKKYKCYLQTLYSVPFALIYFLLKEILLFFALSYSKTTLSILSPITLDGNVLLLKLIFFVCMIISRLFSFCYLDISVRFFKSLTTSHTKNLIGYIKIFKNKLTVTFVHNRMQAVLLKNS